MCNEEENSECGEQNRDKNKRVSAFANKSEIKSAMLARQQLLVLLYKDVYF